jgi:hypothetical protein
MHADPNMKDEAFTKLPVARLNSPNTALDTSQGYDISLNTGANDSLRATLQP